MDVGALLCRPQPRCDGCPLRRRCGTKGALDGEGPRRAPRYEGSFRQRRGGVLALLRSADACAATDLDAEALASLVADGLAVVTPSGLASLPSPR